MAAAREAGGWTRKERALLGRLSSAAKIQRFLDGLEYRCDGDPVSPRTVMVQRRAHCFDGALFAAAALEHHRHSPRLMLLRAVRDDDHLLAVYRAGGHYGAVAKSNFSGLRWRQPVYRSLRELASSYFESYFNLAGERTLRTYSRLFDLRKVDHLCWRVDDAATDAVAERLDAQRRYPLLTPSMVRRLAPVDPRSRAAGMLGTALAGAYRPR